MLSPSWNSSQVIQKQAHTWRNLRPQSSLTFQDIAFVLNLKMQKFIRVWCASDGVLNMLYEYSGLYCSLDQHKNKKVASHWSCWNTNILINKNYWAIKFIIMWGIGIALNVFGNLHYYFTHSVYFLFHSTIVMGHLVIFYRDSKIKITFKYPFLWLYFRNKF